MADPAESGKAPASLFQELKRRHVVRVAVAYAAAAWLVLQLADVVLPAFDAPAWVLKVLIGLVALLFPIALVLAWAFEMTPEGVRRTTSLDSGPTPVSAQGLRVWGTLNTVTIVLLVAAVALLSWRVFGRASPAGPAAPAGAATVGTAGTLASPSIAVLPFANGSGDPKDQYFSDGLSEDLIIALSQLRGLKVIGRESSFQFRGEDIDSRAIGRKLGVANVVEGSVSREGDEIRLRAELVKTEDGSTVWSARYDRRYRNLFALQDDLTDAVAGALQAKLLAGASASAQTDRPPGGSLEAYDAYLEGSFAFQRANRSGLRQAIDRYRQAVELDPHYAAAWAALSYTWSRLDAAFLNGVELRRGYDSAAVAADRALSLDPRLSAAHRARGMLLLFDSLKWRDSEVEFRKALELAPGDARAKSDLAFAVAALGRVDEAVRLQREALASNPLDIVGHLRLGQNLTGLARYGDARDAYRRALQLQPAAAGIYPYLAEVEVLLGDTAAALREAHSEPDAAWRRFALALAYTAARDTASANVELRSMIARDATSSAYQIADAYAFRGEPDSAFQWLNRAWQQRDPGLSSLLFDPLLLRYRDDPRFTAFCREVGLPAPGAVPG